MVSKPVIFISAASGELRGVRDLVAKTLTFLGYEPVWQDIFGFEDGTVQNMLRRKIDSAQGLVQIVGHTYGAEPPQPDPQFGRVSYTQFEALYARKKGKRVWYLVLDPSFIGESRAPESDELRQLQQDYRTHVQSGEHLYHELGTSSEIENRLLKLRDDLAHLRVRGKLWAAIVTGLLILLAVGGFLLMRGQGKQGDVITQVKEQNDKLVLVIRNLSATLAQTGGLAERRDEAARLAAAYADLERKHGLQPGSLKKELPDFARTLLSRTDTRMMDRAGAEFALKDYAAAERSALLARDQALAAGGGGVEDAIAALQLAGHAALQQVQYARSIEHYRAAVRLTDENKFAVLWAQLQDNIAEAQEKDSRYHDAELTHRQVKAMRQRVLGEEHPDTLGARNNVAHTLRLQAKPAEAELEIRSLLEVMQRVLGPDHPSTLMSRGNLAAALQDQGKHETAETEHRAVLEIRQRVLGPEHPNTLATHNNLGLALHNQAKYAEAEKEYRIALEGYRRALGLDHPEALASRNNLAMTLRALGKTTEAEAEHRAVLEARQRLLGPLHTDTLTSRNNLAAVLGEQGKFAEAEAEFRAVLEIRQRVLGREHPQTLTSQTNLAQALRVRGRLAEAEAAHRAVLEIRQRVLAPDHPEIFRTCFNIALCLMDQKKVQEALPFARRASEGLQKSLGEKHHYTQNARKLLEQLESEAGAP